MTSQIISDDTAATRRGSVSSFNGSSFSQSRYLFLMLGLIAAFSIFNFATLGRVPAYPHTDDGLYAAAAYQFWQTGKPGCAPCKDVVGVDRDVWAFGRIAAAVQGVFLHFVGVSVFTALLPSFLVGLLLLAVTVALGRTLWDTQTGLLAALLLAASAKFFETSHWARPDILLALFFLFSLWLVASVSLERPYGRLFGAGLVMGLAGDVHINGFLIAPVPLLFWLLLRPVSSRVRWRAALTYVGAGCLAVLFWLALHYWPDPQAVHHQAALWGGETHGLRIIKLGLLGAIKAEVHRYIDWFWDARGHRHLLEGLCILGSGIWMLRREGRAGRALVGVWIAVFLIGAGLMSLPWHWYLIYVWPLFTLWMARAFLTFPKRRPAQVVLLALLAAYLLNLGLWYYKAQKDFSFQALLSELRHLIPANEPVLADRPFWYAFWDRDYTNDFYLYLRRHEAELYPETGPRDWAIEQRKRGWRYIVVTDTLGRFLDPEVPLEELLSSEEFRGQEAEIRDARAFSLERCSVERRISRFYHPLLILRVNNGAQ